MEKIMNDNEFLLWNERGKYIPIIGIIITLIIIIYSILR